MGNPLNALRGHSTKAGEKLKQRADKVIAESQAELYVTEAATEGIESGRDLHIDPTLVCADPYQPRRYFNEATLKDLAATIDAAGQLQPVLVLPIEGREKYRYQLVAGERRWRAISTLCKKTTSLWAVPVDLLSRRAILEAQIIENDARESTLVMEKAMAYSQLVKHYADEGIKGPAERASQILGISKANMSKYRSLADQADILFPLNLKHPKEGLVGLYLLAGLLKSDPGLAKQRIGKFEAQKDQKSLRSLFEADSAAARQKRVEGGEQEPKPTKGNPSTENPSTEKSTSEKPLKYVGDIEFQQEGDQVRLTLFLSSGEQSFLTDLSVLEKLGEELRVLTEAIA